MGIAIVYILLKRQYAESWEEEFYLEYLESLIIEIGYIFMRLAVESNSRNSLSPPSLYLHLHLYVMCSLYLVINVAYLVWIEVLQGWKIYFCISNIMNKLVYFWKILKCGWVRLQNIHI